MCAGKSAILLVAWGAFTPQAKLALSYFETLCRRRFPAMPIRWAYTSLILRERLLARRQKSDSVYKALKRLWLENFQAIAVQPLQTIAGREHEAVAEAALQARRETGLCCALGEPLLHPSQDLGRVARALLAHVPEGRQREENLVFMGHGARHRQGAMYTALAQALGQLDSYAFVGAMSGDCDLDCLLPKLAPGVVWLLPLLSTVGRHAISDMAGDGPDSWRARLERAGHACRPVLRGMAECEHLASFWLDNLAKSVQSL